MTQKRKGVTCSTTLEVRVELQVRTVGTWVSLEFENSMLESNLGQKTRLLRACVPCLRQLSRHVSRRCTPGIKDSVSALETAQFKPGFQWTCSSNGPRCQARMLTTDVGSQVLRHPSSCFQTTLPAFPPCASALERMRHFIPVQRLFSLAAQEAASCLSFL